MSKFILLIAEIIVLLMFFSCSNEKRSDRDNFDLVGDVKCVTSVSYDVFDKFDEGNLQKSKPNNSVVQISSFDSLGNILSNQCISIDDAKRSYTIVKNEKYQTLKWLRYEDADDSKIEYGNNYFYDDRGNLLKEIDILDNEVTNYTNTYDNDGHIISQIGGDSKNYWYYENGVLVKAVEHFYDMTTEFFYENGLLMKDIRDPEVYWTHSYDGQRRNIEDIMFKNGNINKKIKSRYSDDKAVAPFEMIEWNSDGAIEHDYLFTYFVIGNDTVTILKFDTNNLYEIEFHNKDSKGITEETYNSKSTTLFSFQYIYEYGNLVVLRDLKTGNDYKYSNDIATVTDGNNNVTETKYSRNVLVSKIIKDTNGNVVYSYVVNGDGNKKTITVINNGEKQIGEQIFKNGKLVKNTDAVSGITSDYTYNKAGNVSKIISSDGTVLTYEYKLDSKGNWVRKIEFMNGKPKKIWERSIEYF